jgi:hypothetical protein
MLKGEDWLRRLYQQDIALVRDQRQQIEWVVRNRYPIGIGPSAEPITEFRNEGFEAELSWLAPHHESTSKLTSAFNNVSLMNRAPNLNAAKLYLNWLLSAEGQAVWAHSLEANSRRLDVAGPAETMPRPDVNYINPSTEDNTAYLNRAMELAKATLR